MTVPFHTVGILAAVIYPLGFVVQLYGVYHNTVVISLEEILCNAVAPKLAQLLIDDKSLIVSCLELATAVKSAAVAISSQPLVVLISISSLSALMNTSQGLPVGSIQVPSTLADALVPTSVHILSILLYIFLAEGASADTEAQELQ